MREMKVLLVNWLTGEFLRRNCMLLVLICGLASSVYNMMRIMRRHKHLGLTADFIGNSCLIDYKI